MKKRMRQTLVNRRDFGSNQIKSRKEIKKGMILRLVTRRGSRLIKVETKAYVDQDKDWVFKFSYVKQHSYEKGKIYIEYLTDCNIEPYDNGRWNPNNRLMNE